MKRVMPSGRRKIKLIGLTLMEVSNDQNLDFNTGVNRAIWTRTSPERRQRTKFDVGESVLKSLWQSWLACLRFVVLGVSVWCVFPFSCELVARESVHLSRMLCSLSLGLLVGLVTYTVLLVCLSKLVMCPKKIPMNYKIFCLTYTY